MINRDLQAAHQLLSVYEKSKLHSDLMLDTLPAAFAVIDQDGKILRGNADTAALYQVNLEELLGQSIYRVFEEENRMFFRSRLNQLIDGKAERAQFDLGVLDAGGNQRLFVWDVSPFEAGFRNLRLFKVIGRDVTDFRKRVAESIAIAKELEITKAIQTLFLPKQTRLVSNRLSMASYYQPADQVGGDWWWFEQESDSSMLVLLADVSGHGVGSAMVTAVLSSSYNLIRQVTQHLSGVEKIRRIFEMIHANIIQTCGREHWVCLSAVQVLPETRELVFWNAGGPPLYIKRKDGSIELIKQPSNPLVGSPMNLRPSHAPFSEGDRFFLLSDGVIDFEEASGSSFTLHKLRKLLESYENVPVGTMVDDLIRDLNSRQSPTAPVKDDRTLIAVGYQASRSIEPTCSP